MSAAKEFLDAKAAFLDKARNATATDGIIDGGQAMEAELVSLPFICDIHLLINLTFMNRSIY
jgi:hypothetical protein